MKLKNRSQSPVGGFFYEDPLTGKRLGTDGTFNKLIRLIQDTYAGAGIDEPSNLKDIVEDQICTRQPPGRCYYTRGLGDMVSQAIHIGARGVDKALGTNLEKKARGCSGCAKRRARLNKLTS